MTADQIVEHKVRNEIGRLFVLAAVLETSLQAATEELRTANNKIAELTAELAELKSPENVGEENVSESVAG